MPRLAWFSPLPPNRSGIAAYNAELLPLVAAHHSVEVFVDSRGTAPDRPLFPVFPSRDFVWRNVRHPYDLVVYQMGNSPAHDYMWPYLVRFPGLAVLHDAQLHHSRALALISAGRTDDYRKEFAFCHPEVGPAVAETIIAGVGGSLFYLWPLVRVPIAVSRLVAVHGKGLAALLRQEYPTRPCEAITMGVGDPRTSAGHGEPIGARVRARHGIAPDAIVFAAYGVVTPEKRLPQALLALRAILPHAPRAHLLLVGSRVDHYDVEANARELGVSARVTVTGYVGDDQLPDYLDGADVCLSLRWPTSRETSAAWLRCLAAGKPTIITDLVHNGEVPALDPRTWTPLETGIPFGPTGGEEAAAAPTRGRGRGEAIAVAIDILDEQHSLGLAMRRLALDARLRAELGHRAREYWQAHHTTGRMANDYLRAIDTALRRPAPAGVHLPEHLVPDARGHMDALLAPFGFSEQRLGWEG